MRHFRKSKSLSYCQNEYSLYNKENEKDEKHCPKSAESFQQRKFLLVLKLLDSFCYCCPSAELPFAIQTSCKHNKQQKQCQEQKQQQ